MATISNLWWDLEGNHSQERLAHRHQNLSTEARCRRLGYLDCVYIRHATADRTMVADAVGRHLREVTPTKEESTQEAEIRRAETPKKYLGKYSMAALTPDVIANFQDESDSEYSSLSSRNSKTNGSLMASSGVIVSPGSAVSAFWSIAALFRESAMRS
jgi:ADP-ribosylglycohydrolase